MTPGPLQPPTVSCILLTGVLGSHRSATIQQPWWRQPGVCPICLCFIKVNILAPSSVYFSTTATYIYSWLRMFVCSLLRLFML